MKLKPTMNRQSVAILVPSGNMVHADFARSLALMVGYTIANGVSVSLMNRHSSNIANLREGLAERALQLSDTHFLWVDSDMVFPAWSLLRLLSHRVPIVASAYAKRGEVLVSDSVGYSKNPDTTGADLLEAESVGFGFVLMKREVLERMKRPRFPLNWNAERDEHMGEDNGFCDNARALGYKLMIDQQLTNHMGHAGLYIHMLYDQPIEPKQAREICADPNPPRIAPR